MEQPMRHCACLIVGEKYQWQYVDRLYAMLSRHSSLPIKLHVLTERDRVVSDIYVKHVLNANQKIRNPRDFWWYKLQLFDAERFQQSMVYFDLDTVIVDSVDWIWHTELDFFWAVKDFWYLWNPGRIRVNSSIMRWDPEKYHWIWQDFCSQDPGKIMPRYPGDQDYIDAVIPRTHLRFFDNDLVQSWRWEVQDGGWDFRSKKPRSPGHTSLGPKTSVLIFHGNPKPHQIDNELLKQHWK